MLSLAAMKTYFLYRPSWQALVICLIALALYVATAAPSIFELYSDSLEFQLVAPTFGIAHPSGYPLYTLLGGLWSRLLFPFGNWAWRMNFLSAIFGAGTIAVLFLLGRRLNGCGWGAAIAALTFGLSPVWWRQTTAAEVYGLHLLIVAGILYVAITAPRASAVVRRSTWQTMGQSHGSGSSHLAGLFLLSGLGLAHHRTTVLLLPGVALYVLWQVPGVWYPQRKWKLWAAVLLLPLLLYLYMPMRAWMGAVDLEGAYVNTWSGFWKHTLATGYSGFFRENALSVSRTTADWLSLFREQFGWLGLLLGVVGLLVGLFSKLQRPAWALILFILVANALFSFNYRVGDAEVFLLPVFLCLALGIGNGMAMLGRNSWFVQQGPLRHLALLGLPLLILLAPGRAAPVNRLNDWAVHDYAVAMAKVSFPPGSRVVGLRGQMTALAYMQQAEGLGANAEAVALDDPAARRAFVEASVAAGDPVFLTQELDGIEEHFSFSGEGPLVRVWPRGKAQPDTPSSRLDLSFDDDALRLLGVELVRLNNAGGPALRALFFWQPNRQITRTLKLSLRLFADGQVLLQEDHFPLRQVAPSWSWLPGEVMQDVYELPLPPTASPLSLLAIIYDADTVAEVGRVTVPLPFNVW